MLYRLYTSDKTSHVQTNKTKTRETTSLADKRIYIQLHCSLLFKTLMDIVETCISNAQGRSDQW